MQEFRDKVTFSCVMLTFTVLLACLAVGLTSALMDDRHNGCMEALQMKTELEAAKNPLTAQLEQSAQPDGDGVDRSVKQVQSRDRSRER